MAILNANNVRAALMLAALMLVGCRGDPGRDYRAALAQLSYPEQAQRGPSLKVYVVRDGGEVRLANASAKRYEGMQLWLNRRFVHRVDELAIGSGNRYDLARFVDRHGQTYPVAGLLSPQQTEPVVLAELYDPVTELRHRLTVQPDETEDE
jgi:hypothetical protein